MAMDLNAKAAYIRGLMTGMEFDASSKEGRIIAAMMDLLEEMASTVVEHDDALDQVYDELEVLDEDLDDVVCDLYGEDDEDTEDGTEEDEAEDDTENMYEVTCPKCGVANVVTEDELLSGGLTCPECGETFDVEVVDDEDSVPAPEKL